MTDGWVETETLDGFSVVDIGEHWETVSTPVVFGPPAWRAKSACLGEWETMTEKGDEARAICASCPVREECLAFALDTEPDDTVLWAGTTFEERCAICPICRAEKPPEALGCSFLHVMLRTTRLLEIQAEGDPDVRVSMRTKPSYRTNPWCVLPRGHNHSAANAYRDGCRCEASIRERNEDKRRLNGVTKPRRAYGARRSHAC